jgi:SseB protein N-terminal domain
MFGFIKKIYSTNALTEIGKSGDARMFAKQFANSEITLLSLPIPDSIDADNLSQDKLLALVENAALEMSHQTSVDLFTFSEEGSSILPVFTDNLAAENFVRYYVAEKKLIIPFQVFTMQGATFANYISAHTIIIINPKNDSEYRLSKSDLDSILRTAN